MDERAQLLEDIQGGTQEVLGRLCGDVRVCDQPQTRWSRLHLLTRRPALCMNMSRVLLANGHCLLRQGLKKMLISDGRVKVVGEAESYDEAVTLAQELTPDVVVLDAEEPVARAWNTVE